MRKDFESAFSRSSQNNLRRVSRRLVMQEQNASSQFSPPLSCNFLAQTPQFCCIICTIYRATLFKIISHDYPLSQKTEAITFPAEETLARVLPLHALHFRLWGKVMNTCLILGYNSVDKKPGIIVISRQEIPRNIEQRSFLVISQHSRYPCCRDIGHTQDIC